MSREYSTTDLARNWSEISARAMRQPITLTRHRKPQFVLLSVEDYQALLDRRDPRRALRVEETPEDLAQDIADAVARLEDEEG